MADVPSAQRIRLLEKNTIEQNQVFINHGSSLGSTVSGEERNTKWRSLARGRVGANSSRGPQSQPEHHTGWRSVPSAHGPLRSPRTQQVRKQLCGMSALGSLHLHRKWLHLWSGPEQGWGMHASPRRVGRGPSSSRCILRVLPEHQRHQVPAGTQPELSTAGKIQGPALGRSRADPVA